MAADNAGVAAGGWRQMKCLMASSIIIEISAAMA